MAKRERLATDFADAVVESEPLSREPLSRVATAPVVNPVPSFEALGARIKTDSRAALNRLLADLEGDAEKLRPLAEMVVQLYVQVGSARLAGVNTDVAEGALHACVQNIAAASATATATAILDFARKAMSTALDAALTALDIAVRAA